MGITVSDNVISANGEHGVLISGGRIHFVYGNLIGTDSTGTKKLGNTIDGIRIEDAVGIIIGDKSMTPNTCDGRCNVISANRQHGITIMGDKTFGVFVRSNFIGTDRSGQMNLANTGRGIRGRGGEEITIGGQAHEGNLIAHHQGMFSQRRNAGIALIGVTDWTVSNNLIRDNNTGILLLNSTGDDIKNNTITNNQCGIEQDGAREDKNILELNFVNNNQGGCTGIRLESGTSLISGNSITGDVGNGITIEGDARPTITDNIIMDNGGFGVFNANAAFTINAQSNWWGHRSGPSDAGPGSGEGVGAGIDFSNWRTEIVALVSAPAADTVLSRPGSTDSTLVFFRNWANPTDVVDVTISEEQNWLVSPLSMSVTLTDENGGSVPLRFDVPAGSGGTMNKVRVNAVSRADPTVASVDSFYIAAYLPALAAIALGPDSVLVVPGDTVQFVAQGSDQFGQGFAFDQVWSATGGAISNTGTYVVGDERGDFLVSVTDPNSTVTATAAVFVVSSVGVEEEPEGSEGIDEIPDRFALYQSYPNPFNPTATISYDVKEAVLVDLRVYDVIGREVVVLVRERKAPGRYATVFDARSLPSGLYLYRIKMGAFSEVKKMILLK